MFPSEVACTFVCVWVCVMQIEQRIIIAELMAFMFLTPSTLWKWAAMSEHMPEVLLYFKQCGLGGHGILEDAPLALACCGSPAPLQT